MFGTYIQIIVIYYLQQEWETSLNEIQIQDNVQHPAAPSTI